MAATYATIGDPVTSVANLIESNWSGAIASGVGSTPTTIKATWEKFSVCFMCFSMA